MYPATGPSTFVVRPDRHLGFAACGVPVDDLVTHLRAAFGMTAHDHNLTLHMKLR